MANAIFVGFWLVLPFSERKNSIRFIQKTYNCIVFANFQHKKLYSFQNLNLGFILKIFLKFCKFQPGYSYKTYCYKKECIINSFYLQISQILHNVCKKEGLSLPAELSKRIAEKSNRNLRRALLMCEACRVQQYVLHLNC